MTIYQRGSRGEDRSRSDSSFVADLASLKAVVRKAGYALDRLLAIVETKVTSDDDLQLAEELCDELKPIIDALVHFEVP